MKTFLTVVITAFLSCCFSFFCVSAYAVTDPLELAATPVVSKMALGDSKTVKEVSVGRNVANINTGDVAELIKLNGIGVKKAEAIIAWRNENGKFKSVDDLRDVKGIGEATLEANRKNIRI